MNFICPHHPCLFPLSILCHVSVIRCTLECNVELFKKEFSASRGICLRWNGSNENPLYLSLSDSHILLSDKHLCIHSITALRLSHTHAVIASPHYPAKVCRPSPGTPFSLDDNIEYDCELMLCSKQLKLLPWQRHKVKMQTYERLLE